MNRLRFALVASLATLSVTAARASAQRPEALWYSVESEPSVQSFLAHADEISIVSPQTFAIDSIGVIWGSVDRRIVETARAKGVKVIPLVVNPGFDQSIIHRVLTISDVRQRAIRNLAALCREQRFDGIQFDFENVNVADRDAFTAFSREVADSLHAEHCSLSAAVVPRSSDFPGPTPWHRWIYENWRGAYDYKALADAMDFISFMTYAQHTGGTSPGPVAGYTWIEDALKYALSLGVPPEKLSLGIPAYSDYWYPSWDIKTGAKMSGNDVSYATAMGVLARNGVTPTWDDRQKNYYAFFDDAGVNEFVWIEDARAFKAKLGLVAKYKLRGYSVWVLGLEDPGVWK